MHDLVLNETHNVENDNDDGHVVAGVPSELFHGSRATHVEDLLAQFRQHRLLRKKMTIDDAEARARGGRGTAYLAALVAWQFMHLTIPSRFKLAPLSLSSRLSNCIHPSASKLSKPPLLMHFSAHCTKTRSNEV